jgi:ABC-type Fe3+/spermidine/putrescine transport system ATPase subunit
LRYAAVFWKHPALMPEPIIVLDGLQKSYRDTRAVDGVSLAIAPGEIFGFLGANGAGKTTTIRMLCGLVKPSGGSARIAGRDVWRERYEVRTKFGYVAQKFSLYPDLTVVENLRFFGGAYRVPRARLDDVMVSFASDGGGVGLTVRAGITTAVGEKVEPGVGLNAHSTQPLHEQVHLDWCHERQACIAADRPSHLGVGDVVDLGPVIGTVEEVALRYTRLRDLSGVVWYVRNGEILRVANRSQGWTLASVDIPVAYDEDLDRVRDLIESVALDMDEDPTYDDMLLGKPTFAGVESMSGEAMVVRVTAKAVPEKQIILARTIRERIKLAFDRAGIVMPMMMRPMPGQMLPGSPPAPPSPRIES